MNLIRIMPRQGNKFSSAFYGRLNKNPMRIEHVIKIHFLLLLCVSTAFAQNNRKKLQGVVRDINTQTPIAEVLIESIDQSIKQSVFSDSLGNFVVSVSDENAVTFQLSHIAYESQWVTIPVKSSEYTIYMKPSTEYMEYVIVSGIRSDKGNPATATNIKKGEIEKQNFGQDLPLLLNSTPSTVVSSDAGAGVGYTGIRIRGVDPTRINVTINGIPLNDAEAHGVYWVDLPDFASSANSIQIQRGVGTSTNGSSAFGSSINVKTDHVESKPFASADVGIGSFNTQKLNTQFGTGVLASGWGLQGRFSAIQSDGFIDRASSDLKSMFVTAARYGKNDLLKFNFMAGHERTYQAWYGVPQPKFKGDKPATESFMNDLYFSDSQRDHLLKSGDQTYNPYTYKDEVDNYDQHHLQLFYNRRLNSNIRINTGLHYTHGFGYYEQFREGDDFADYGIQPLYFTKDTIESGNFIRRRWLNNQFYGGIGSVEVTKKKSLLVVGGGVHQYDGQHYGEIIWAEFASNSEIGNRYYENDASKLDANIYAKYTHQLSSKTSGYLDLQARNIAYNYENPNDGKDYEASYLFINPKLGFVHLWNAKNQFNLFLAMANREPVRDDFISGPGQKVPTPERLYNLEMGDQWTLKKAIIKLNYYMMYYQDQLVLNGSINTVGEYVRINVPSSYRTGLETEIAWQITKKCKLDGNLTLSQNRIISFTEYVDDWNTGVQVQFNQKNKSLAFSPASIGMMAINYTLNPQWISVISMKTVGKQYLDNSESEDRMLEGFTVLAMQSNYTTKLKSGTSIQFGVQLNNLLNLQYAPNGYTFGTMDGETRKSFNYVYPMAGRNIMLRMKIEI